jgi:hypothetical protein
MSFNSKNGQEIFKMSFLLVVQTVDINAIVDLVQQYVTAITEYVLGFVRAIFPVMIYVFTFQIIVRKS